MSQLNPSLAKILKELISTGFTVNEVAHKLKLSKENVEAAITILLSHHYITKLENRSTCDKCPLRDSCGLAANRSQTVYTVTAKGLRLMRQASGKDL